MSEPCVGDVTGPTIEYRNLKVERLEKIEAAAREWFEAYSAISSFTPKEHMARAKAFREALAQAP